MCPLQYAAKYVVNLETAKDDDPIFKQAVPTFEPGTHARRKTHHQLRLLGRSQTPDAAKERSRNMLSFQRTRSGTGWMKGKSLQATRAHWTLEAFRLAHTVPRIVSRVDALLRGSERPAPRGVLPGVGREPGCVTLPDIYMCN